MSNVTDVVRAAIKALPAFLGGMDLKGIRVEEVEPPEVGNEWRVTLSYLADAPEKKGDPFGGVLGLPRATSVERVLRVIVIDGETLAPKKMKIRE